MKILFFLFLLVSGVSTIPTKSYIHETDSTGLPFYSLAPPLVEDFESGSKATYAPADVQLTSGSWFLNNALFGTLASDQKNGTRSVRIRNLGSIRMNFDYSDGASTITVKHAVFGSDHTSTWELQVSTDGGSTYISGAFVLLPLA